jgi:hypothetical protein
MNVTQIYQLWNEEGSYIAGIFPIGNQLAEILNRLDLNMEGFCIRTTVFKGIEHTYTHTHSAEALYLVGFFPGTIYVKLWFPVYRKNWVQLKKKVLFFWKSDLDQLSFVQLEGKRLLAYFVCMYVTFNKNCVMQLIIRKCSKVITLIY